MHSMAWWPSSRPRAAGGGFEPQRSPRPGAEVPHLVRSRRFSNMEDGACPQPRQAEAPEGLGLWAGMPAGARVLGTPWGGGDSRGVWREPSGGKPLRGSVHRRLAGSCQRLRQGLVHTSGSSKSVEWCKVQGHVPGHHVRPSAGPQKWSGVHVAGWTSPPGPWRAGPTVLLQPPSKGTSSSPGWSWQKAKLLLGSPQAPPGPPPPGMHGGTAREVGAPDLHQEGPNGVRPESRPEAAPASWEPLWTGTGSPFSPLLGLWPWEVFGDFLGFGMTAGAEPSGWGVG